MSGYAMLSDSRVAGLLQDWNTDPTTYQLVLLHRVDASEIKEKKVLTLACMYLDWNLRSMIVEYNKTNDEYRINVVDYSEYATDDDYNAGVTKLTTEIISGSVPDIFLTSNLPIDKYAAKGAIADLNTFMDGGNGLSRDYFVPQVMSALEKDGKLYELPTSFSAPVLSRMILDSREDATAKAMRLGMLAFMRPVITSAEGRWVAITRWTPAARPIWATRQMDSSTSLAATNIRSASSSMGMLFSRS